MPIAPWRSGGGAPPIPRRRRGGGKRRSRRPRRRRVKSGRGRRPPLWRGWKPRHCGEPRGCRPQRPATSCAEGNCTKNLFCSFASPAAIEQNAFFVHLQKSLGGRALAAGTHRQARPSGAGWRRGPGALCATPGRALPYRERGRRPPPRRRAARLPRAVRSCANAFYAVGGGADYDTPPPLGVH